MATPSLLDVDALLAPIPGESPAGRSLAYELEYDQLKEARRAEDDAPQGEVWQRKTKLADWDHVVELGSELLREKTKDLQIAAWITEALTKRHGFAGLRDGLRLVLGIHDRFWDNYYPLVEDGDLESRSGPFVFLNNVLPLPIRSIPLTAGLSESHYNFLRWQEGKTTDNVGLKSQELMETLVGEGKITSEMFDKEVAQTPRRFYENLVDDLRQSFEAFQELDRSVDGRFGRDAPGMGNIRKALEDCRKPLEPILARKRQEEPDPGDEGQEAVEDSAEPGEEGTDSGGWDEPAEPSPTRRRRSGPARSSGGPIASIDDAHQRIFEAAAYLRQQDATSPVPFLVVRSLRMGEVYASGSPPEPERLEAPSSEVRVSLRRLTNEGQWADLLEQAEQAISRPEGRAWLDAQRFAVTAMLQASDVDRSAAIRATKTWLQAFLQDFPGLLDAELCDGTPTANAETRTWIREEILPSPPQPAERETEPSENGFQAPEPSTWSRPEPDAAASAAPDPYDEALAAVQAGRTAEGLQRIRSAMVAATTGRERFQRKLQLAELCLLARNYRVALPISEDLARQVDEFRLEDWEDQQLSARVWGALYRCLRGTDTANASSDRLQQVFTRLCRLDINQALMYGDEKSKR